MNELEYFNNCLNYYFFNANDIEFFELDNPIFIKFNSLIGNTLEFIKDYDFNFISLGYDCFIKFMGTRYGFIPKRAQFPFDEMVTPLNSLIKILKNDFRNFYAYNVFFNKIGNAINFFNPELDLIFNHDRLSPNDDLPEQFINLNDKIRNRIHTFYSSINDKTTFVLHINNFNSEHILIDDLLKLIIDKFKISNLLIINTNFYPINKVTPPPDFIYDKISIT